MKKKQWMAALSLCFVAALQTAQADTLITTTTFSGPFAPATGLQYFDPSLGTLNSVNVSITGTVTGQIAASGPCDPNGCTPLPYLVTVDQTFQGIAGQFFSSAAPAEFQYTGSGFIGEVFPIFTSFGYSFDFNTFTDVTGQAIPAGISGPLGAPVITGHLQDFLTPLAQLHEVDVLTTLGTNLGTLTTVGIQSNGSIVITYVYTPTPPQPAGVPESGTLAPLGGLALALCGLRAARRPAILPAAR